MAHIVELTENLLTGKTVSAGYLKAIYDGAMAAGVDKSRLSAIPGLSEDSLAKEPQRFPAGTLLAVFKLAADHTEDRSIGARLGLGVRPVRQIDVIYATTFCETLLEATELNFAYQPLIQEIGQTHLEIDGPVARCVWTPHIDDIETNRFITEAVFTGYAMISRWLLWAQSPMLKEVRFRHNAPKDTSVYQSIFGSVPIFGARRDEVIVDMSVLKSPIPGRNPNILKRLISRLDVMLLNLDKPTSNAAACRSLIMSRLGRRAVSITDVSEKMNMSERNLRRKLSEENTSYRALLEDCRREAAIIYMADSKISISEIAQSLGFNDQSAFSRAFKLWMGQSPAAYRRAAHAG